VLILSGEGGEGWVLVFIVVVIVHAFILFFDAVVLGLSGERGFFSFVR
jgi:hypothetical protein